MNKEYSTILILTLALIVLYLLSDNFIFLYISLGTGTACLISSWLTDKIHWGWMKLSTMLGAISSFVILSVVFFIIMAPLSFIAKLTGKKFVVLKRSEGSYFKQRDFLYDKESLENLW